MTDDRWTERPAAGSHSDGERIRSILGDLLDMLDDAAEIVSQGRAEFMSPGRRLHFRAAKSLLIDLNSACDDICRLDPSFPERYPPLPWNLIAATHHKCAHHNADINRSIVWETLETNLPPLRRTLERARAELDDSPT